MWLSSCQGAVIFVSHDETFINSVLNRDGRPDYSADTTASSMGLTAGAAAPRTVFQGMEGIPVGELWVLSKRKLRKFDGNFTAYKKAVNKRSSAQMSSL